MRPLLTDIEPLFVGLGGYDLFIEDAATQHLGPPRLVNRGPLIAYSDGMSIIAQQRGDDSIIVHTYGQRTEDWKILAIRGEQRH